MNSSTQRLHDNDYVHNIVNCLFPSLDPLVSLTSVSQNDNDDEKSDGVPINNMKNSRIPSRDDRHKWIQDPTLPSTFPLLDRQWLEGWLRHDNTSLEQRRQRRHEQHQRQQQQNQGCESSSIRHRLVRHVGMVQDMMEPEYYRRPDHQCHVCSDQARVPGNDASPWRSSSSSSSLVLLERQPLVIVPLPYGKHFPTNHHRRSYGQSGRSDMEEETYGSHRHVVVIPESPPSNASNNNNTTSKCYIGGSGELDMQPNQHKREREDEILKTTGNLDGMEDEQEDDVMGRPTRRIKKSIHSQDENQLNGITTQNPNKPLLGDSDDDDMAIQGPEKDWWPMGCLDSDPREMPILAKMYYDEYNINNDDTMGDDEEEEKGGVESLKLNDIVECVGIVSSSYLEEEDDDGDNNDFSGGGYGDGDAMLSFFQHETMMPSLPPHSRLPRLHVLYFRKLHLQDLLVDPVNENEELNPPEVREEPSIGGIPSLSSSSSMRTETLTLPSPFLVDPIHAWTDAFGTTNDDITVWQALFLTLISQAERTTNTNGTKLMHRTAPPEQQALGCASLQLKVSTCLHSVDEGLSSTSSSGAMADIVFEQLVQFLRMVCPMVASVDLVKGTTTTTVLSGPGKETGRLFPTPWQLPKGATIVIRYDDNDEDDGNEDEHHHYISNKDPMLHDLVSQHLISYSFEGGMKIPFEADYRIIVVTNDTRSRLPCTLCCTINGHDEDRFKLDTVQMKSLREAISRARVTGNIPLAREVLEQAQKDFLYRRGHGRTEDRIDEENHDIRKEQDFHRWLTLTRLFARARGSTEAVMADWHSALELDDAIRVERK